MDTGQPWSKPKDDMLRELWMAHSAAEIAIRIGAASKNAVIGRARRLGLPPKAKPARAPPPRPSRKQKAEARKPRRSKPLVAIVEAVVRAPLEPTRSFEALVQHECRFPIGDPGTPGFGFCGRPVSGRVYCAAHHAVAYVTPLRHAAREIARTSHEPPEGHAP